MRRTVTSLQEFGHRRQDKSYRSRDVWVCRERRQYVRAVCSRAEQNNCKTNPAWILISIFAPFIGAVGGSSTSSTSSDSALNSARALNSDLYI